MPHLLRPGEVAALKGCSKKTVHRACEQQKVNSEFDPVTGEYRVYDDEKLASWQPGEGGRPTSGETPDAR